MNLIAKDSTVEELTTLHLFHRLWTKAVGTDDYDKGLWLELSRRVERLEGERDKARDEAKRWRAVVRDLASLTRDAIGGESP